ncbi:unnamed protein product [Auanema sp. JU1783]|nr:unnamed protein product [Auanema sp. JU1783]
MNIPETSMMNLPLLDFDASELMETHARSIPVALLYVTMNSFVADFSHEPDARVAFCDLISPEPKKTRKLLYLVSEFLKFHKIYDPIFSTVSKQYEDQKRQLDDLKEKIDREEKRKSHLKAERESRSRRENALRVEIGKQSALLQKHLKEASSYVELRKECIQQIEDANEEKKKLLSVKEDLNAQLDYVSKGIIESPEKISSELEHQRQDLDRLRDDCANTRKNMIEIKGRVDMIPLIDKQLDGFCEDYEKMCSLQSELAKLGDERGEIARCLCEAERKLAQVFEKFQNYDHQIKDLQESSTKDDKLHVERMNNLKNRLIELETEAEHQREVYKDMGSDLKKYQKELMSVKMEKSKLMREAEAEVAGMTRSYEEIIQHCTDEKLKFNDNMLYLKDLVQTMVSSLTGDTYLDTTNPTAMVEI